MLPRGPDESVLSTLRLQRGAAHGRSMFNDIAPRSCILKPGGKGLRNYCDGNATGG